MIETAAGLYMVQKEFTVLADGIFNVHTVQGDRNIDAYSWSDIHDDQWADNNTYANSGPYIATRPTASYWADIWRSTNAFILSSLPPGTIQSATLSVYVTSRSNSFSGQTVRVCAGNDPALGQYNNFGTSDLGSDNIAIDSVSLNAYNTITLASGGISLLQTALDGDTEAWLGLRLASDLFDTPPSWSSSKSAGIVYHTYNSANPPKLVMQHQYLGIP